MNIGTKIISKFFSSTIIQFFIVFVSVFIAFYFYRDFNLPYFVGEDSFFHVAIAKYMIQHGLIIHQFPYLKFTILNEKFADWHFLYHILLIPFIKFFGDVNGPKILGTTLLAATFSIIYLIFKNRGLKFAALFTIILFFLMPGVFYYRMALIRGAMLSLFLMVLCIYWIIKNRPIALAITMFFFVWSYYLASYFIFVPIVALLICQIWRKEKINYQLLLWAVIGFTAGFIINPYFPNNIHLIPVFFKAGFRNDVWYEGAEIFPMSTWDWFYGSMMTAILFLGSIFFSFIKNIRQDSKNLAILFFALFLLILQWRSARFVEYWPVFGGLSGAILIGPYIEEILLNIKNNWRKIESWLVVIFIATFIYEGIFHGIWEFWGLKKKFTGQSEKAILLKDISTYIKNNSEKGDLIFTRWDFFPYLFYFNDKNYYVDGNGIIWIEVYNQKMTEDYMDLTLLPEPKVNPKLIKDEFGAKWVIAESTLKEKLEQQPEVFEKVLEKGGLTVFKVK